MQGDLKIGYRRKVDVITLSCAHSYWREKDTNRAILSAIPGQVLENEGCLMFAADMNTNAERICDACLLEYLLSNFGWEWGHKIFKIWDKKIRKYVA